MITRPLLLCLICIASTAFGSPPMGMSQELAKDTIQKAYSDGEFELAIHKITEFSKRQTNHSREDSIFIAKYLGVMYAANPETREKGKHYMFKLLEVLPSAKIIDMFASDEIDRIFERVKEEFAIKNDTLSKTSPKATKPQDSSRTDSTVRVASQSQATQSSSAQRANLWWMGGAALVAATGTVAYVLYLNVSSPKDKVYDIPR